MQIELPVTSPGDPWLFVNEKSEVDCKNQADTFVTKGVGTDEQVLLNLAMTSSVEGENWGSWDTRVGVTKPELTADVEMISHSGE